MVGEPIVTVVGNLVAPVELRYTAGGKAVANFTVASTPRTRQQDGSFKDGEALFLRCSLWDTAAESCAESLDEKGMRIIVQGRLVQRTFDTKEGEKRTVVEMQVDEVGPSLRWATAKVARTPRGGSNGGQRQSQPQQAAADPWGAPAAGGGHTDEPPFFHQAPNFRDGSVV